MILFFIFFALHLVPLSNAVVPTNREDYQNGRLSEPENKRLQTICGRKFTETKLPDEKAFNSDNGTVSNAPWTASLLIKGKKGHPDSYCSGVLISYMHVLTAAHCVHEAKYIQYFLDTSFKPPRNRSVVRTETKSPVDIQIVLGDNCAKESLQCNQNLTGTRQEYRAKRFWLHSNYIRNQSSDLVILELEQNAKPSRSVIPVCLSTQPLEINQTVHLYSIGTETLYFDERHYQLQHIATQVADCLSAKFRRVDVNLRINDFCTRTSNMKRPQHPCQGDSGGGVVGEPDAKGITNVVGLVSRGMNCYYDMQTYPDFVFVDHHTAIAPYVNWVCSKTGVCPNGINQPIHHNQKEDQELRTGRTSLNLLCDSSEWVLSANGTDALCYKVLVLDKKLRIGGKADECQRVGAKLAPIRNEAELEALKKSMVINGLKCDDKNTTYIIIGSHRDAEIQHFRGNFDDSTVARDNSIVQIWSTDRPINIKALKYDEQCLSAELFGNQPYLNIVSCNFESNVVACAKLPEKA